MKSIIARWCLLFAGTLVMSAGIVLVTKSNLGTSPISSLGYVMSLAVPSISYGVYMFIWNALLIVGQVAILRRNFKPLALMQIPISILFSIGIDGFSHLFSFIAPDSYPLQLAVLAMGIVVLAFGVSCTVVPNVTMNCGEAFVCAITSKTGWNFGHTKVGFDLSCVALGTIASFTLMGGLYGVREGSLIAAACTGFVVNFFVKAMGGTRPPLEPKRKNGSAKEESASAQGMAAVEGSAQA